MELHSSAAQNLCSVAENNMRGKLLKKSGIVFKRSAESLEHSGKQYEEKVVKPVRCYLTNVVKIQKYHFPDVRKTILLI